MPRLSAAGSRRPPATAATSLLRELPGNFANPGALRMWMFAPPALLPDAPLVVILHGCTQTAAGYDHGAGWSALAAELGFALLFPEQVPANNANTCFNWFEAADTRRGGGEAASIANAVTAMTETYRLNAARVFITGLSAGGAMANVMLATYPDIFAGGAIIAGLPYGAAHGIPEALQAMNRPTSTLPRLLGDRIRSASNFTGPWPRVSVWHGGSDRTVAMANGEAVAAQWANVHDATIDSDDGQSQLWRNAAGIPVVEFHRIDGMGHGTPIDAATKGCTPAPFMLDVGIASSAMIAAYWGLGTAGEPRRDRSVKPIRPNESRPLARDSIDVSQLINKTLRAAGLMK